MPGFGADVTAGKVGVTILGAVAVATAAHAVASTVRGAIRSRKQPKAGGETPPPKPEGKSGKGKGE